MSSCVFLVSSCRAPAELKEYHGEDEVGSNHTFVGGHIDEGHADECDFLDIPRDRKILMSPKKKEEAASEKHRRLLRQQQRQQKEGQHIDLRQRQARVLSVVFVHVPHDVDD